MSFDKLMAELAQVGEAHETMAKAIATPAEGGDDAAIAAAAAAADGAKTGDKPELDADGKPVAAAAKKDGDDTMSKAFKVTLEDGTVVEASDGTEMIKALTARIDDSEGAVAKVLGTAIALIKGQGEMLKALSVKSTEQSTKVAAQETLLKAIGNEGKGRKALLTLTEKSADGGAAAAAAAAATPTVTAEEFMAKAMQAQVGGFLMAKDVSMIETYLNRGAEVPPHLVKAVEAGAKK